MRGQLRCARRLRFGSDAVGEVAEGAHNANGNVCERACLVVVLQRCVGGGVECRCGAACRSALLVTRPSSRCRRAARPMGVRSIATIHHAARASRPPFLPLSSPISPFLPPRRCVTVRLSAAGRVAALLCGCNRKPKGSDKQPQPSSSCIRPHRSSRHTSHTHMPLARAHAHTSARAVHPSQLNHPPFFGWLFELLWLLCESQRARPSFVVIRHREQRSK